VPFGDLGQDFSGGGVVGWESLAGHGIHPLAVDQHLARLGDEVTDARINIDGINCDCHRTSLRFGLSKMFEEAGSTLEMVIPGRVEGNRGRATNSPSVPRGTFDYYL